MFGVMLFVLMLVVGFGAIGAGFKIMRDAGDPTLPGEVRPSAWNAVAAWALGAWILWWAIF